MVGELPAHAAQGHARGARVRQAAARQLVERVVAGVGALLQHALGHGQLELQERGLGVGLATLGLLEGIAVVGGHYLRGGYELRREQVKC